MASSAVKKELDLELQQRIEEHLHRCPVQAWKVDQSNQIPNENLSDDCILMMVVGLTEK